MHKTNQLVFVALLAYVGDTTTFWVPAKGRPEECIICFEVLQRNVVMLPCDKKAVVRVT